MNFPCQICNINPSQSFLTKCCKLFICQECKTKYESTFSQCVCLKPITNKKLCSQNYLLHKIISDYQSKKQKQCDRCSEFAKIDCKNCNMVFCSSCQKQLHNAIGYSNHVREPYVQKIRPLNEIIQTVRNKTRICQSHRQPVEMVCECSAYLCLQCLKPHKQSCQKLPLKPKPISEFKCQFYSNLLYKLSQITAFKQSLQGQITQFTNYFTKQKEAYEVTSNAMEEQFAALRKMLQIKIQQSQSKLSDYWEQCQRVYNKTIFYLEANMKKYDDYAKLIQKFAEHQMGLDFLEKRVKRIPLLTYNSFSFKLSNPDDVRNAILGMNSCLKLWEFQFHENIILNLEETQEEKKPSNFMKKSDLLIANTSQLLYQASQNPLKSRPLHFNCSHNQIQFIFLHLPYHNFKYDIEYGVGFKMKGKEVFKKLENLTGKGLIQGLNASTKYRIRMRVGEGDFGEITEVTTLEAPKFLVQPSNIMKSTSENSFQFLKQGVIYSSNPIIFGIHHWTVILNSQKSSYDQSQTACITVGISNKQKKPLFVGSTFNYGYQRDQIIVKLTVNCEDQTMTISHSQNNQSEEKFSILPSFPIYPAIQNKSSATIHIKYFFGKEENI